MNGSGADSRALPTGVSFIAVTGDVNGARLVLGVVWNGLFGLLRGWLLNSILFCVGVHGIGGGFWYFGGGVLVSDTCGVGNLLWAKADVCCGWRVVLAMAGVSPDERA